MKLIPKPNGDLEIFSGKYLFKDKKLSVEMGEFKEKCVEAFISRTGLALIDKSQNDIILVKDTNLEAEEYKLTVNEQGVVITASKDNAVINAFTTLYLLMDDTQGISYCNVNDKPKYMHRGLSVDCVRNFFPKDEIGRIIEQMSLVKLNTLHLHLSDDQGWRIESKRFPKLHMQSGNDYFSQDDIRELVSFAERRGIEIIPEIDIPGHVSGLLSAYPQYSCTGRQVELAKCGGIYPTILCAGNEKTYDMLEELFEELCPLFTSEQFHIGGDEAPKKEWKKCKCCQEKMKSQDLIDEKELQGYFSNRVMDILRKNGKKPICWNDSLEAANLCRQTKIQFWSVQYAEQLPDFLDNGGKFIYSDMFTFYFDYPYSMTPLQRVYTDPLIIENVDYSQHPALLGIEACVWAEHIDGNERLEELLFPRIYAVAEAAWSNSLDYSNFKERLRCFLYEAHPDEMKYTLENGWDPQGKERQEETFAYLSRMNSAMSEDVRKETVENVSPNKLFEEKFKRCFFRPEDMQLLMNMREA